MKLKICVCAGMILLLSQAGFARQSNDVLRILLGNGTETVLSIDQIRNIVFTSDGQLQIVSASEIRSFPILSVRNLVFSVATSIPEPVVDVSQELLLFPNPVSDVLTVQLAKTEPGNYQLVIFDLNGKRVFQQLVHSDELQAGKAISASLLPAGLYFCRISSEGFFINSKFIKL